MIVYGLGFSSFKAEHSLSAQAIVAALEPPVIKKKAKCVVL